MMRVLSAFLLLLAAGHLFAAGPPDMAPVKRWIARQDDLRSVTADFTQTRALRALRDPLANQGHLWFKAPDSFRWELGNPAKTIVLRKGGTVFLIQPAKKHAERSPAGSVNQNAGARGLGMLSFPVAHDFAEFQKQFETLSVATEGTRCHLEVLPRDAEARKMLAALKLDFDTATGHLLVVEMATRDGSALRNEVTNVQTNAKIDAGVFDFDFTGYDVVDAKP